jgi:hypothetical protein
MKKYILSEDKKDLTYYAEDSSGMTIPLNNNRFHLQILEEIKNGEAEIIPYTPPAPTWEQIRAQRDGLLYESDWVGLSDSNPSNKQAWLDYRQALRNIPQTFSTPESVVWPQKP